MLKSNMVGQIDNYLKDRALFSTDIQAKALKWHTNYTHPFAEGYRAAKMRLDGCITEATARANARKVAYEQLKARIDFAMGILFSLLGPFTEQAFAGLKTSMTITQGEMETKVLTKWYDANRNPNLSFDQLLNRETIRMSVLNYVVEQGTGALKGNIQPKAGDWKGDSPQAPTGNKQGVAGGAGVGLPESFLSGEFTPAEFEQNVQNMFNKMAVELHDKYLTLFNGAADVKRTFLVNATKTVLATPPPKPITETIPASILEASIFAMIAGAYILSFKPTGGRIWPSIGVDLAFTLNKALKATGHSIITNNPKLGVKEDFQGVLDHQMYWDGTVVMPYVHPNKIREISKGGAAVLEAYMQAIAMGNETT